MLTLLGKIIWSDWSGADIIGLIIGLISTVVGTLWGAYLGYKLAVKSNDEERAKEENLEKETIINDLTIELEQASADKNNYIDKVNDREYGSRLLNLPYLECINITNKLTALFTEPWFPVVVNLHVQLIEINWLYERRAFYYINHNEAIIAPDDTTDKKILHHKKFYTQLSEKIMDKLCGSDETSFFSQLENLLETLKNIKVSVTDTTKGN